MFINIIQIIQHHQYYMDHYAYIIQNVNHH